MTTMDRRIDAMMLSKDKASKMTRILETNYNSLYSLAGDLVDCERGQFNDVKWVNNHDSWPERIYGINLSKENIDERLKWIAEGMKSGKLPSKIGTNVLSKPEDYEIYFEKHGIEKAFDSTGMILNMEDLNTDFIPKVDIEIKQVMNEDMLYEFAQLVTRELFNKGDDKIKPYYACLKALIAGGYITCYLAYHKGEAVASSMSYIFNGVVGLYHISTKEDYRGKGIGKQMTIMPLINSKKIGCKTAVLFATNLGKPVYEQVGFKGFCPLGRYQLKATI